MARSYYQKAHGMILTCAINNRDSFMNLRIWLGALKESVGLDAIQLIIIANKSDLESEREVSVDEIKQKAADLGIEYFETSAKSGNGIDEAFDTIFKKVYSSVYKKQKGFGLGGEEGNQGSSWLRCCK
jgi:Ras-related protein Rab-2A